MSPASVEVRELEPGDRDRVRQLHEVCFEDEVAFDDLVLDRVFRHKHTINLVAEVDDRIQAFACAIHGSRPTARLLTIHTHPEARGQGLAQALLDRLEERLRARKADTLQLEVHVDNDRARQLYEDRGFEVAREDPACYPSLDEPRGYVMEKSLRDG